MPLAHFTLRHTYNHFAAICEICGEGGNHYGYGEGRSDIYGEIHDFCDEHAEEYKITYKKKIRKQKLMKLNVIR